MIKINEANASIPSGFREFTRTDYYGYAGAEKTMEGTEPLIKSIKKKLPGSGNLEADLIIAGSEKGADRLDVYINIDMDWDYGFYYPIDYPIASCANIAKKVESDVINRLGDGSEVQSLMKKLGFKEF